MTRDLSSYPSSWIIFAVTSLTFKTIAARYLCNTSSRWCNSHFLLAITIREMEKRPAHFFALRQPKNSKNRNNWALFTVGAQVSAPTNVLCHFFAAAGVTDDGSAIYETPRCASPIVCGRSIWLILINYMPSQCHRRVANRIKSFCRKGCGQMRALCNFGFFWDARAHHLRAHRKSQRL